MKLALLAGAPAFTLPAATTLYRVQRTKPLPGSVAIGADLQVIPPGIMAGRFDLPDDAVGYFAAAMETALYETLVRRPSATVSLAGAAARALLTLQTALPAKLCDLRPRATDWPVLQSPRYAPTWELARDIRDAGYDGIAFRSAQQDGGTCFALFGRVMERVDTVARTPLVDPSGGIHAAVARAIVGAQAGLVP